MKERDKKMDALKGLAILLVVLGHVIQSGKHNNFDFFSHPIFLVVYTFHMPLFIFISGFISYYGVKSHGSILTLVKSRFFSLIVPFIVWSAISYFLFTPHEIMSPETFNGYVSNMVLYPMTTPFSLWFLWALFFCSIIHFVCIKLERILNLTSYLIIWILIMFIPYNDQYGVFMIKWLLPFYFMGYLANRYKHKFMKFSRFIKLGAFIAFVICLFFWETRDYIYISKMDIINNDVWSTIMNWGYRYAIAAFGIITIYSIMKWIRDTFVFNVFSELGIYSLDIYILQTFLLIFFNRIPNISNGYVFNLFYLPLGTLILTLVCYLCGKYILRSNKYMKKLLLGNR